MEVTTFLHILAKGNFMGPSLSEEFVTLWKLFHLGVLQPQLSDGLQKKHDVSYWTLVYRMRTMLFHTFLYSRQNWIFSHNTSKLYWLVFFLNRGFFPWRCFLHFNLFYSCLISFVSVLVCVFSVGTFFFFNVQKKTFFQFFSNFLECVWLVLGCIHWWSPQWNVPLRVIPPRPQFPQH